MHSIRTIIRGTVLRFVPGYAIGFAALMCLLMLSLSAPVRVGWGPALDQMALATVGYFAMLVALRFRLGPAAHIDGRRSVVAGAVTPAAVLVAMVFARSGAPFSIYLLSALGGALMAFGMFMPWLKSKPVMALTQEELREIGGDSTAEWNAALIGNRQSVREP